MPDGPKKDGDKKKTAKMPPPENKQKINHIFKNKHGHLPFTPENYALLKNLVEDAKNYLGLDMYGKQWFGKTLENGTQLWAYAQNGKVISGGLNETMVPYCPINGLIKPKIKIPNSIFKG